MELLKKYHKVSIKRGVGKYRFISSVSRGELSKNLVSLFSNTEELKRIQATRKHIFVCVLYNIIAALSTVMCMISIIKADMLRLAQTGVMCGIVYIRTHAHKQNSHTLGGG